MPNIAVLIVTVPPPSAAGTSSRPFAKVENREIFMRTIELYANRDAVTQRVLCVGVDDLETVHAKYSAHLGFQGVNVTAGGPDWFGVVARGLEKLKPEIEVVFVHDACCPVVPFTLLDALDVAVAKAGAVAPALPVAGSVVHAPGNALTAPVESGGFQRLQYPHVFKKEVLVNAYAQRGAIRGNDDITLVHLTGGKVTLLPGSEYNVRIDSDELQRLAGDYLKHLPKPKSKSPLTPFDEAQW